MLAQTYESLKKLMPDKRNTEKRPCRADMLDFFMTGKRYFQSSQAAACSGYCSTCYGSCNTDPGPGDC